MTLLIIRTFAFACLGIVSFVVGIRMLRLARRTREFPELAVGLHILLLILGYGVEFAGIEGRAVLGEATATALRGLGNLFYAGCIGVYLVFSWRVFRPESALARLVTIVGCASLAIGWTGEVFTGRFDFSPARFAAPWFWLAFAPRLVCMGWASFEALHEYGRARRRLALGLTEAMVVNRFFTWGLAALSELMIYLVVWTAIARGVPSDFLTGPSALIVSAFGLTAAVTILVSFLPPPWYRRWIEAEAGARSTA